MADGGSAVKQFTEEVAEAAGEVAKDVKDTVGQMLEQGVQSATGAQLTPQQIQQKQIDEQTQMAEARRKIAFYRRNAGEQKIVRQENKQKEQQRLEALQQEIQQKKIEEIQQKEPKKPGLPEAILRTQAEYKPGKGVGG